MLCACFTTVSFLYMPELFSITWVVCFTSPFLRMRSSDYISVSKQHVMTNYTFAILWGHLYSFSLSEITVQWWVPFIAMSKSISASAWVSWAKALILLGPWLMWWWGWQTCHRHFPAQQSRDQATPKTLRVLKTWEVVEGKSLHNIICGFLTLWLPAGRWTAWWSH